MTTATLENFFRGDTVRWKLEFTNPDTDAAIDISDWIFTVTLKKNEEDADADAALQITTTAPADATSENGEIELVLPSNETANLTPGVSYFMDIQRKIQGTPPDILTLHKQRIKVLQDVTVTV